MARRSIGAIIVMLGVAVMVGLRESTGTAPPPPTLTTEVIEWLSPELEDDDGSLVVLANPVPFEASVDSTSGTRRSDSLVAIARSLFRRLTSRHG